MKKLTVATAILLAGCSSAPDWEEPQGKLELNIPIVATETPKETPKPTETAKPTELPKPTETPKPVEPAKPEVKTVKIEFDYEAESKLASAVQKAHLTALRAGTQEDQIKVLVEVDADKNGQASLAELNTHAQANKMSYQARLGDNGTVKYSRELKVAADQLDRFNDLNKGNAYQKSQLAMAATAQAEPLDVNGLDNIVEKLTGKKPERKVEPEAPAVPKEESKVEPKASEAVEGKIVIRYSIGNSFNAGWFYGIAKAKGISGTLQEAILASEIDAGKNGQVEMAEMVDYTKKHSIEPKASPPTEEKAAHFVRHEETIKFSSEAVRTAYGKMIDGYNSAQRVQFLQAMQNKKYNVLDQTKLDEIKAEIK